MDRPDAALIHDEYASTIGLLRYACDRGMALLDGSFTDGHTAAALGESLRRFIGEYRRIWMERNRIGGLAESVRLLDALLPGAERKA